MQFYQLKVCPEIKANVHAAL